MLRLIVERGPDAGRIFLTRSIYAVVGRSGEIALSDRSVSGYHALIQVQDDNTILLTDLNSENGTWLGYGERSAEQLRLKSGMCFKVGSTVLRVHLDQTAALLASEQPAPALQAPQPVSRPHVLHVADRPNREDRTGPLGQPDPAIPAPPAARTGAPNSPGRVSIPSRAGMSPAQTTGLELEFDPEILAVAEDKAQAKAVELKEPQRVVIPTPAQVRPDQTTPPVRPVTTNTWAMPGQRG
jgi:predicted component of type VI protein secretion system